MLFGLVACCAAAAAPAQEAPPLEVDIVGGISAPMPIAVPVMPTPAVAPVAENLNTEQMGRLVAEIVVSDLRNSGLFTPRGPDGLPAVSYPQVTAPNFGLWTGAQALVQGFVQAKGDGKLTVGCYLYDVAAQTELTRQGLRGGAARLAPRRAPLRRCDLRAPDRGGRLFRQPHRLCRRERAQGKTHQAHRRHGPGRRQSPLSSPTASRPVLTPRFSPDQKWLTYMSYDGERPQVWLYDMAAGRQRLLVNQPNMTFAPRFSPDSRSVVFSMAGERQHGHLPRTRRRRDAGAADQCARHRHRRQLFSGRLEDRVRKRSRRIPAALRDERDGSDQRRISFGSGQYGTPVWSPRGDMIAYTKIGPGFRIGVMNAGGGGERVLTEAWQDEGPSWAPNGRVINFFRTAQGSGRTELWSVDLTGINEKRLPTPLDGSDPSWSPLLN
jgi:TolB protein